MKTLFWITLNIGMVELIVSSYLFMPIREFFNHTTNSYTKKWHIFKFKIDAFMYNLLNCRICTAFWTGLMLSIFVWSPILYYYNINFGPIDGIFSIGVVFLTEKLIYATLEK